jgi:spore photoproduct lyase
MDKNDIIKIFGFSPGFNQLREIDRLIFEICRRENIETKYLLDEMAAYFIDKKITGPDRFIELRKLLLSRRFPLTIKKVRMKPAEVFIAPLTSPIQKKYPIQKSFTPEKIFIENTCAKSWLSRKAQNMFPDVPTEFITHRHEYIKNYRFELSDLKLPLLFIVHEKFDHIKPCPCTPKHIRCGYWILNLGFGCPFDCSYCYLQHYTNFPGVILPANIEDFFAAFDRINTTLASPIRIGTGEFTDSLALDHITEYSKKLITYFADKKVLFELKTKSANIDNLLKIDAPENCVIAWSLNTETICAQEELGAATLPERFTAAQQCQKHGLKLAFHFDPVIHSENWQEEYKKTIERIYANVKPPFAWISLGTLRSNRELKTACEKRFPKSNIFYGELLLGDDKKLRYPEFLREEIYLKMIEMLRAFDQTTPIYLCMETKEMWKKVSQRYPLKCWVR